MTGYRVTVLKPNIVSLVQTGELRRWHRDFAKDIENTARRRVPKRTRRLEHSHVTLPTTGSNQYETRYRVSAMAAHGVYVHEGTGIFGPRGAPIISTRGMGPLPNAREGSIGRRPKYIYYSRGQRPKPWLEHAAQEVVARRT